MGFESVSCTTRDSVLGWRAACSAVRRGCGSALKVKVPTLSQTAREGWGNHVGTHVDPREPFPNLALPRRLVGAGTRLLPLRLPALRDGTTVAAVVGVVARSQPLRRALRDSDGAPTDRAEAYYFGPQEKHLVIWTPYGVQQSSKGAARVGHPGEPWTPSNCHSERSEESTTSDTVRRWGSGGLGGVAVSVFAT